MMHPIDHFKIRVEIDTLDGGYPRLENFEPAYRPVLPSLPRHAQPRGPGRPDASYKDQRRIGRTRHIDSNFAVAKLTWFKHEISLENEAPSVADYGEAAIASLAILTLRPFLQNAQARFRRTKQAPPARRIRLQRSS